MSETTTETTETTTATTEAGTTSEKTLTQADVDRIVADRVAREKSKYADYGDLKAKAARLDEIESANASELEKAVKTARDEARAEVTQTTNGRLVNAEARALAAEIGFRDPADALGQVDLKAINVDENGDVDSEAIKKELEELAKRKDYLLKAKADTSASDAGIGTTGTTSTDTSPGGLIRAGLAATSKSK